jgi:integrase/recombinase XerD
MNRQPKDIPNAKTINNAFTELKTAQKLNERRDFAIMDLLYSCGLRRCEIENLDINDINATESTLKVHGKGDRERIVPIGKRTLTVLLNYLYQVRPALVSYSPTNALFISWQQGGKRINARSINRSFVRYRKKFNLDPAFTPHGLRHAFATDLVRNGAPIQDVALMLGHTKLETTQIYTHLNPKELQVHHARFHPRGG